VICPYDVLYAYIYVDNSHNFYVIQHVKILYAACTEITCWWWTVICSKHV